MSTVTYVITARSSGVPSGSLTPTWTQLRKIADGTSIGSPGSVAVIRNLGGGGIAVDYDPESGNGELWGILDFGVTISDANERYADVLLAKDPSRVLNLDTTITSRQSGSAAVILSTTDATTSATGTAQAGGSTSITLAAGASAIDNFYKGDQVRIVSGTGAGQSPRTIISYIGSTKVATVDSAWVVNPDNTSVYAIRADRSAAIDSNLALTANTVVDKAGWGDSAGVTTLLSRIPSALTINSGGVTIAGYAAGQDPATLLLLVPANKIYTDASGEIRLDLTQTMTPLLNPADNLNGAFLGARAGGFGVVRVVGTPGTAGSKIRIYAADATTLLHEFDASTIGSRV